MKAFRGPKVWLWRWRRNPLKRPGDTLEAWVLLGAWLFTLVAGVLGGLAAARSVDDGLARERAEWHPVVAHVMDRAPGGSAPKSPSSGGERVWARVGWTVADGSARWQPLETLDMGDAAVMPSDPEMEEGPRMA